MLCPLTTRFRTALHIAVTASLLWNLLRGLMIQSEQSSFTEGEVNDITTVES